MFLKRRQKVFKNIVLEIRKWQVYVRDSLYEAFQPIRRAIRREWDIISEMISGHGRIQLDRINK